MQNATSKHHIFLGSTILSFKRQKQHAAILINGILDGCRNLQLGKFKFFRTVRRNCCIWDCENKCCGFCLVISMFIYMWDLIYLFIVNGPQAYKINTNSIWTSELKHFTTKVTSGSVLFHLLKNLSLLGVAAHIACILDTHSPVGHYWVFGMPSPCVLHSPQPTATHI